MRHKLVLPIALLVLLIALTTNACAGDELGAVFEQWLVVGNAATYYDACADQHFIQNTAVSASDQVRHWIKTTPVALDEFSKGTTDQQVRDAMTMGLTKSQDAFNMKNPVLTPELCGRVATAWANGAKHFGG